jgi:cell wall-associated NlpC family hydrolase
MQVTAASAPLHREPRYDAGLDTEALCGERVRVFEVHEGWAWVQLETDDYVGYTPADRLGSTTAPATHRVATPRTYVYPGASMKLPHVALISLGARLTVIEIRGSFAVVVGVAGLAETFVWAAHLVPLSAPERDPVGVAERLLHTPYLWGGKQSLGLDCSGLVQTAYDACGLSAPRDSDMQERALGMALGDNARAVGLQRGDLVFWKGHVGLMQDETRLIHANGHHMLVASEPLQDAMRRIEANGGGTVTRFARPVFTQSASDG